MGNGTKYDMAIAVMGATGTGKSTFINLASGSNLDVGHGLGSCTNEIQLSRRFRVNIDGKMITLIDTPGFDDTKRSETEVLKLIAKFLAEEFEKGVKLSGILFLHRISDFRMGGISVKNFRVFRELCGSETLRNVVIVTNMWGEVQHEIGMARLEQLATDFFKPALDKGAKLVCHNNTFDCAHTILKLVVQNQPLELRIQQEMVTHGVSLAESSAYAEGARELREREELHHKEMIALRKAIEDEKPKLEEARVKRVEELSDLSSQISEAQDNIRRQAQDFEEEVNELEWQMEGYQEAYRQDKLAIEQQQQSQLEELERRLEDEALAQEIAKEEIRRAYGDYH